MILRRFIPLVIFIPFLIISCSSKQIDLNPEDIQVSAEVRTFSSISKLRSYFGFFNDKIPNEDYLDMIDNTIEVITKWEISPLEKVGSDKLLYYPPYIVIIPGEKWGYAGTNRSHDLFIPNTVRSLPGEIIENVLKDIPQYSWYDDPRAWILHAKSFEQGFTTLAFNKLDENINNPVFTVYFIYYDPLIRKGWVKEVNLS